MKQVTGKEFAKVLERNGWTLRRVNGSHYIYAKAGVEAIISLPIHANRPVRLGLLRFFMKVAELTETDLST